MAKSNPKIVVIKEDFNANEVAEESVSVEVIPKADVQDAVTTMAGDFEPEKSTVLSNKEFNLVFANMTDAQVKDVLGKPGVASVEDDEKVFALEDDPIDELDGNADEILDMDEEASIEIDEAMDEFADEEFEAITPEQAALASQIEPDIDEIEIDDSGEVISLDDTDPQQMEAAGIPRDKIRALIKCIIQCAIKQFAGKVQDVPEEKLSELLAGMGLAGDSESVRAVRDYITCGLKIIYAPHAWRYSTGFGVRVAVVDTGIAPRHPDLRVFGGASFVPGVTRWHDDQGHGTHVAGTIAGLRNGRGVVGVAPSARLYAVKVLNGRGSGYTSWILNGLAWCYRYRMHVVNLSLGSMTTNHAISNYSRAYESAGRRLRRRGILAVAAAGNSGRTSRPYVGNPARCPSFMAVSSIDCRRRRSSFSSYGPQVEICAPGSNVISTYPPNRYRRLSGTSMASPHAAGVAALVKRRHPSWTGDRIRVHMWRTALDLGSAGRDWLYGYGQVRAYHAVR